ncbi:MAG TPA: TetR/AcrR family transcriptional regulator [Nocardioidaceae bacterium]|nr:TetR/AcrR family transcriptional regulator [Nocardioidaceae bacterium]
MSRANRRTKDPAPPDGRSTRWDNHREARRAELVAAAVTAMHKYSREASIDEIARVAGVSKPVLYRYFSDKSDLHAAVGQWGASLVVERLAPAFESRLPLRQRVAKAVSAYLEVIEEHPQVFLLLVQHRVNSTTDPLADGKAAVAATLTQVISDAMSELGIDTGGAEPWAHAVVGLGLSTGEWYLERKTMSRAEVSSYLTEFVWGALVGISRNHGITLTAETVPRSP